MYTEGFIIQKKSSQIILKDIYLYCVYKHVVNVNCHKHIPVCSWKKNEQQHAIINFFFERDFAQQPKSALILTTLHVLFDTLYVNCNDQIMALAATICSTSKET